MQYPVTPDGRYFVVKGRLWRMSNPALEPTRKEDAVKRLMKARRSVRDAKSSGDEAAMERARRAVNSAKVELGERGPVWWTDGAEDFNRQMVSKTPYAEWFASL